ncbi:uncharacterized protein LOC111628174 [Centruroides sculpturatus]|uniref:uncharacterized protein LOC111628174 n=1 Tax=Centruroides sculpturatus TaxID=218467 RepID=UPI000C6E3D1C|nr:uncharacterized protein LOC111628174 [Centruroides sculpturatus]
MKVKKFENKENVLETEDSMIQKETSTSLLEICATQMEAIANDFETNLMENILKSVSCQSLDLTNENLPKSERKQIDSEDGEIENEEKISKNGECSITLSKPGISRINDFIIVSVLFVVFCTIATIKIFSETTYHEETIGQSSFNLNIIDILLLLAIAIASCFGFLIYYNGYISDRDPLKKKQVS